ncbi:DUF1327 domain-containing protein [Pectobacterium odoriferum]|uniref:DUF1327 domain-containing protein n=1 Tax=Pectobacterium odoriferum TaxID=78398 RepID=UPI001CF2E3F1|nr:DUF1327 domain-containing protein [Pectobacterium odoriferum]MCA6962411.1 YdfR family protein [Pectobacterium odoriferum]MCH5010507.1 DUF1327 domain-containing protein [Pectobacterium odoriferum]
MEKRYELKVSSFYLREEYINATVDIASSQMPIISIFSVQVSLERQDGASLSDYEKQAKDKAVSIIQKVANELMPTA